MAGEKWKVEPVAGPPSEGAPGSKWKTSAPPVPVEADSDVNPIWEGVKQGASFGFADEAQAALGTMFSDQTYRDRWQELQAQIEAAKKANPVRYYGGEVGGSLASLLIPGLGEANLLRLGKLGQLPRVLQIAGLGAAQGGLNAVGQGGELSAQTPVDALTGAGIGGALGVATAPVAKLAGKYGPAAVDWVKENVAKPALKYTAPIMKVPFEVGKEVLENVPTYLEKLPSGRKLATELVQKVNEKSAELKKGTDAARALLSDEPVLNWKDAAKLLDEAMTDSGAIFKGAKNEASSENIGLLKVLGQQKKRLQSLADEQGFLSETKIREMMDALQPYTKFSQEAGPSGKAAAKGYNMAYGRLNELLKGTPDALSAYGEAMAPIAKGTDEIAQLAKDLGLKKGAGERYRITDASIKKVKNLKNNELLSEKVATQFPEDEFAAMANRLKNEKYFQPKSFSAGSLLGSMINPMTLGPIGVARDVAGGPIWRAAARRSDPYTTAAPESFEAIARRPLIDLFNPYDPNSIR